MTKDLSSVKGTVAQVMLSRMHEINFEGSLQDIKSSVIEILQSPEIKQQTVARKYIVEIQNMTKISQLLSTLTTYITGTRVSSKKR